MPIFDENYFTRLRRKTLGLKFFFYTFFFHTMFLAVQEQVLDHFLLEKRDFLYKSNRMAFPGILGDSYQF